MKRTQAGFTLIELMVVVAIVGVLAAIGIVTFTTYTTRAKTSEAAASLKTLFTGAATYYLQERWPQGVRPSGSVAPGTACVVDSASPGYAAGASKHTVDWSDESPSYEALDFEVSDPVYYEYHIVTGTGSSECSRPPNNLEVYSFRAQGDLDGDGKKSTFELAVGSNGSNQLYRGAGIYVIDELE